MLPKSYIVFKWTVYGLATIALFAFQYLVLDQITVWGLTPFLYPMLPAVAASYEGLRRGSVFALVLGVVCDLLVVGPFDGFYTLAFTLAGVIAASSGRTSSPPAFSAPWWYPFCSSCSPPGCGSYSPGSPAGGFPPHGGDRPGGDGADPPGGRCCVSAVPVGAQEVYG